MAPENPSPFCALSPKGMVTPQLYLLIRAGLHSPSPERGQETYSVETCIGVLALKAACKAFQTSTDQLLGGERGGGRSRSGEEHQIAAVCRVPAGF